MTYHITRKKIVYNTILMSEVMTEELPEEGWYYHSDGEHTYRYVFATAGINFDSSFPPDAEDLDGSRVIYWYMGIGNGNGPAPHLVRIYTLLLGDETEDALFIDENPVADVNDSTADLSIPVSTEDGQVEITARSVLSGQNFREWIPLWGSCLADGRNLTANENTDSAAVAVYGYKDLSIHAPVTDILIERNVIKMIKELLSPQDLVADYLDERHGLIKLIDKVALDNDKKAEEVLESTLRDMDLLDSRTARLKLVGVQTDIRRLHAIEKILSTIIKK